MNNNAHNIPPQAKIILWYMERNSGKVIRTVDVAIRFHCTAPYAHRVLEMLTEAGVLIQARANGVLGYVASATPDAEATVNETST